MVEYCLQPGDLIVTERALGIILENEGSTWRYACAHRKEGFKEWRIFHISRRQLYANLDEEYQGAKVSYVPGRKRRKRPKK
tara:strand:- start:350 stop:592 length:243 start_codon:yes stop_codon:yes gene_type:complete